MVLWQCFLNLFLHYILSIFQVDEIIGGGAKRYVCPTPQYFHGGGGRLLPSSPRIDASGGKRLGRARGDVYSGGSRICKKGVGGKIRARKRAPHTGGVQGQSPCRGPRGQSPRKLSSFQQIRAFKMVVRSDRKCNFSRCNFAYRALVGGAGVTRFSVVVDSMAFPPPFFFFLQYVPENICNWLRASEPKFSYFPLKTCDC